MPTIIVMLYCQVKKLSFGQKKAHLMEIQINGGTVASKVDFAYNLFEKQVRVASIVGYCSAWFNQPCKCQECGACG